ncbi:MAG: hypothetical protein AAFN77_13875 [Planctomycetota bacterium]
MKRLQSRLTVWALTPALALICTASFAQEDNEPVVEAEAVEMTVIGSDDGSPPVIFSSSSSNGMMAFSPTTSIVMGSGDMAMPAPNPWSMINNPSVQKDLELVGDQLDKVKELQQQHNQEIQKHLGDIRGGSLDLKNIGGLKESMSRLRAEQEEQLRKLLLPHQIDRLKQIALQTHMKQSGTANALINKKVAEELDISEEQVERLKEKSKELKEKLAKDIEKLKAKMKDDLLEELTPEQRTKIKEMTGEKYEPKQDDWRERFKMRSRPRRVTRPSPSDRD